jgi:competence protein ComEC
MLGVAADRFADLRIGLWLGLGILMLAAWIGLFVRRALGPGAACLLAGIACAGGAWHHLHWSAVQANDLSAYAAETPQAVRLVGTLRTQPVIVPKPESTAASAIPEYDRTLCTLDCRALVLLDRTLSVSGRARLEVSGHLLHAQAGDEVEVFGALALPANARNPGGFDFRQYLRRSGVHSVVRTDHPDCVRVVRPGLDLWGRRWRSRWQHAGEQLLHERLSPRTAPVAVALLLGPRAEISPRLQTAFAATGMVHILAISGLNVAILAAFLVTACRLLFAPPWLTTLTVCSGVLGYTVITNAEPPVVRATVILLIFLLGKAAGRGGSPANFLALAVIAVLVGNPADLFHISPQLSFLAVAGLLWSARFGTLGPWGKRDPLADVTAAALPGWRHASKDALARLGQGYLATAAVWLFTLPLMLARFHLISPIGFLLNVWLMPWMTATLWVGYGTLLCGLLVPPLTPLFAFFFECGIGGFLWAVEAAARIPGGHFSVPGPPDWWLAGFYAGLAVAVVPAARLVRSWAWRGLAVWVVIGLASGLQPQAPAGLRCTFLAVGHGGAILLELPDGRTLLYDAGSLQEADRARQTVENLLWQTGRNRVDALLISHADIDHFNAVPGLVQSVPVGCVYCSPTFLDFRQQSVVEVCDAAAARRVPIKLVWAGDRLQAPEGVALRILHPHPARRFRTDNANSLVLAVEYAGRRLLLTGDLEHEGLAALVADAPLRCDVLLAPHHGSRNANTPKLASWATPRWVVVSGGRGDTLGRLEQTYGPEATVLSTTLHGAITIEITPRGELTARTFRPRAALGAGNPAAPVDNYQRPLAARRASRET